MLAKDTAVTQVPQLAVLPGSDYPLGAVPSQGGTNFAVSSVASQVQLCLFDADGAETRLTLPERRGDVWHGFVPAVGHGQQYGFRVAGAPGAAVPGSADPGKLLLDPYARAITGQVRFEPPLYGADTGDSAGCIPRGLVVQNGPPPVAGPRRRMADTVLYEVHVKGLTMTHPGVPDELRGTYAGLAHPAVLEHLIALGVTAVELLPVHHYVPERFLVERGLTNYWGYNTIGFFAPHEGYSAAARAGVAGGQVAEFAAMVSALHQAGLEVILDVVFNHTAEAGPDGPTLSHRGLHERGYYQVEPDGSYVDTTGCGNSLNAGHPMALRMVMDSLRYWVQQLGVDGFRFDLAPTLARQSGGFDSSSAFFDLVTQDPVVSQVKLIAEPWDVGRMDSYDIGRFPSGWSEWNGSYRDTVRDFWRGQEGLIGQFASRISGSADLYAAAGRRPSASVNIVTVHDGMTLTDLVTYDAKHNEANTEDNRDGSNDNRSWNCGVEGPTDDPQILALRAAQRRAMLATLLLSAGTPHLLGGDEIGRTQQGNNNAYCQDNPISWYDWDAVDSDLLAFTRRLVLLRRSHPVFRRRRYLTGAAAADLAWFTPAGTSMSGQDWVNPVAHAITVRLDGDRDPDHDAMGHLMVDTDHYLLVNAWSQDLPFRLPAADSHRAWHLVLDTYDPDRPDTGRPIASDEPFEVSARSLVLLSSPDP